jgi:hypothetical protein
VERSAQHAFRSFWNSADPSNAATARQRLLPGLVAGLAFLAVAMVAGMSTTTAWGMPDAIAAAVGIPVRGYGFQPLPVVVGVAVHLTVSMMLGALYQAIAQRLHLHRGRLVFGAWLFSGLETPVSIWGVLHTVLPASTFRFFLGALPFWASLAGRHAYGLVLGLAIAMMQQSPVPAQPPRRGGTPAGCFHHRLSLAMTLLLLVQFLLGMVVNLYVSIPDRHPGAHASAYFAGVLRGLAWVIPHGSMALAAHAVLGLGLILLSVAHLITAWGTGSGTRMTVSTVGMLALIGAAFNGASFVNYGHDLSSLIMSGCFALALLCYIAAGRERDPDGEPSPPSPEPPGSPEMSSLSPDGHDELLDRRHRVAPVVGPDGGVASGARA